MFFNEPQRLTRHLLEAMYVRSEDTRWNQGKTSAPSFSVPRALEAGVSRMHLCVCRYARISFRRSCLLCMLPALTSRTGPRYGRSRYGLSPGSVGAEWFRVFPAFLCFYCVFRRRRKSRVRLQRLLLFLFLLVLVLISFVSRKPLIISVGRVRPSKRALSAVSCNAMLLLHCCWWC